MGSICVSLAPVASPACRVLVLGSMPGVASLAAQQYYAHPRNTFWPILYALWDAGPADPAYEKRLDFALSHGIALWDVAQTCHRTASSDATIRDALPNDFPALFARCPQVHTIFFNGRTAQTLFMRLAKDAAGNRRRLGLPSTSAAHTQPMQEKIAAWRALRAAADRRM